MKRPYRPFRSPFARLLASVLVTLALLVNGFAMAQAAGMPADTSADTSAKSDCCADMTAEHADSMPWPGSGNPCPASGGECNDECLARCVVNTAVPSAPAALPEIFQRQPAQLELIARAFSSPQASPGLRPPISA